MGSRASDVPAEGPLESGVASQLAALTIEGALRVATRYGSWFPVPPIPDTALHAYQRWWHVRGILAQRGWDSDFPEWRGWVVDHPTIALKRGSSPSTEKALITGRPRQSAGCRALRRVLPAAAIALTQQGYQGLVPEPGVMRRTAQTWARDVALLTHDDGERQGVCAMAGDVLAEVLTASDDVKWAIKRATYDSEHTANMKTLETLTAGFEQPCVPQQLERLAPDKTSWSALAGGLYVAMSFPDEDTVSEAIEFAGWAPDGDSVAAVAGALLGARHGYEALPAQWVNRLEIGG